MANKKMPFYPIIYVRGYAMTNHDINETTADPFNGFNLGSTMLRARKIARRNFILNRLLFVWPRSLVIAMFLSRDWISRTLVGRWIRRVNLPETSWMINR